MASATRGSGPWKPKATRVSSRILVLVDSMSALERPESRVASIAARLATMRCCEFHERGQPRSPSPGEPPIECVFAFFAFDREHVTQCLL